MKVAVIGAGASGLVAAGFAALNGHQVDVFEKNEKSGKKLYITGKGRCNVTNNSDVDVLLNNIVNNPKFLYGAFNSFNSQDTINFFENLGVKLKTERGNRVFPESDKSSDIIMALNRFCLNSGVNFLYNHKVTNIEKKEEKFTINTICGVYNNYDYTILCTGGKTYSATGSTGDGYVLATKLGHTITEIKPALVPIILDDGYIKNLEGLSLKNVKLVALSNKKIIKEFFGEMLFTDKGISGPIALSMSSYINRLNDVQLYLDLKPALTEEKIINRINREIENSKNIQLATLIYGFLPKSLAEEFIIKININRSLKIKSLKEKDIKDIAHLLKYFDLNFSRLDKLDYGIVTSGGVNIKEINPKTMESKLCKNLFFAGEIIDVDALTGGFNLQIAFATGYVAGNNI